MVDILVLAERVKTAIELGESHFREFKSCWEGPPGQKKPRNKREIRQDICRTVVGFANADGGSLLVGVEDDGEISGLGSDKPEYLSFLESSISDGIQGERGLENCQVHKLNLDGKSILYFSVLKSTSRILQTSDGRCLQRRDLETIPISVEELTFTRAEQKSQEYDREFVDSATVSDLNTDAVKALAETISQQMSVEKCLQHMRLAEFSEAGLRLRRAALLLFAKDIQKWHPRVQIRIMKVNGTEVGEGSDYNVIDNVDVQGNILEIIERAWDTLRPHLVQTRLTGAAKFEKKIMYPELACREALINAIAHRDYSQEGRGIELYVFDDRLEVTSPGMLLSSLSVEDLKNLIGAHQSRNTFVARVLRELGYMQEVGEGMRRIFRLMSASELSEPEIANDNSRFSVILSNKTQYSPEHVIWLESFQDFELSREEKAIVVLGYGEKHIAPSEIWEDLGIVDTDHYRRLIEGLQKKGILLTVVARNKAKSLARIGNINIRDVPRYKVAIPEKRKDSIRTRPRGKIENFDSQSRLHIGNLPREIKKEELINQFRSAGFNVDVMIPRSSRVRGSNFAFIQFDSPDEAKEALAKLDGLMVGNNRLRVSKANPTNSNAL